MSETGLSASRIDALRQLARRHADTSDEADDLVQDMLLAALEQRRAWDDAGLQAWAHGVFRRRAALVARTEWRRRRREASWAADAAASPAAMPMLPREFVDALPPSLRTIALLANIGLGRSEIASLLGIADTALRQRISGLRRAWRSAGGAPDATELPRGYLPPCGRRRRSLKAGLARIPGGRFAVADPDGHPIVFGTAHIPPARGNKEAWSGSHRNRSKAHGDSHAAEVRQPRVLPQRPGRRGDGTILHGAPRDPLHAEHGGGRLDVAPGQDR